MSIPVQEKEKMRFDREFDSLLLRAVDHTFQTLFGASSGAVYYHLERGFDVKRANIPSRVKRFSKGLKDIFGRGSFIIERMIVERMYVEMNVEHDKKHETRFHHQIRNARRSYLRKKWRHTQGGVNS